MSYLTLDAAKLHSRVTISDDDDLIQDQIDASEAFIAGYLGVTLASTIVDPAVIPPPQIMEAIAQMVTSLYDQREVQIVGQGLTAFVPDPNFYMLLSGFKTYVF